MGDCPSSTGTYTATARKWRWPALHGTSALLRCLRCWPCLATDEDLALSQEFQQQQAARPARDILDLGCSVGVSTQWLACVFPDANILGADLSPYFLAVAELRER